MYITSLQLITIILYTKLKLILNTILYLHFMLYNNSICINYIIIKYIYNILYVYK